MRKILYVNRRLVLSAALMGGMSLTGMLPFGADGPAWAADAPERLVIAVPLEVDNFDVMTSTLEALLLKVGPNIAETLTKWDIKTDKQLPLLAESWMQVDPTHMRVKLRAGVKFSNGKPLTADDVVASLMMTINDKSALWASYFPTIIKAERVDDLTVDLITAALDPVLERRLQFLSVVPAEMADKKILASSLIGTGPYIVESWTRGQGVLLKRNPDYWGEPGKFEEVEFIARPETSVRADALRTGEAHIATDLEAEQLEGLPRTVSKMGSGIAGFMLNSAGQLHGSIMQDIRVRKAVNYAVDRQAIIDHIFGGYATLPKGQYNNTGMRGTNPDLVDYPYDPAKARALLEEAGAVGKTVRIHTSYDGYLKAREFTEAVSNYLREVGLVPDVQVVDSVTMIRQQSDHRRGKDAPYDLFRSYHSNEFWDSTMRTAERLMSYEAGNGTFLIKNDDLDSLIQSAVSEVDPDKRVQYMREAWKVVHEQALALVIAVLQFHTGMAENLVWEPRQDLRIYVSDMSWK